jgi:hypothetical protein
MKRTTHTLICEQLQIKLKIEKHKKQESKENLE